MNCVFDVLEEMRVPVTDSFFDDAVMAWWHVPVDHECRFCMLLPVMWRFRTKPRLRLWIRRYFQLVILSREEFKEFVVHLDRLLE